MTFRFCFTTVFLLAVGCIRCVEADFEIHVRPLLNQYCIDCHSGDDASAQLDFTGIQSTEEIEQAYDILQSAVEHVESRTMPPRDADSQPTDEERRQLRQWFTDWQATAEARPAKLRPRRLSAIEYRNTLQTLFGFDLEVAVIEAEQTLTQRSLVIKLLPTDPPGKSGFTNDTHQNALTPVAWDQYSYLTEVALEELFSPARQPQLKELSGGSNQQTLTANHAKILLRNLLPKIRRRPLDDAHLRKVLSRFDQAVARNPSASGIVAATRLELKAALLAPEFLYRSLLVEGPTGRQAVDSFELAERLSYFLWADMPDQELLQLAANNELNNDEVLSQQVERMLSHQKAQRLASVFALQWFHLNEIEHVSGNIPVMVAFKSQPLDFMHYLFTEDRPLLELIESRTAFISAHTKRFYGRDGRQMTAYKKQKGIEVEIVPNQKIELRETKHRGGLLTMPGILAMNRGPILRGTWILETILGQPLPDPPPDVGQVEANQNGQQLTFRQRFEQHRSQKACAVCHDKIDPLGFALERYDSKGAFRQVKASKASDDQIDTSGRLPTGETFESFADLKKILATSQRRTVLRNIAKKTLSYALCRRLSLHDQPIVDEITESMDTRNGTWRQLMTAIVKSTAFRETILP